MINDDRSDFAAPIAAFLFIALASLISTVYVICVDSEIQESAVVIRDVLCIGGLVIAGFNLYKGYLAEGFSAALFALFIGAFDIAAMSVPMAVGLGLLFAFCALVSYKTGIMDLAVIDAIAAVVSILLMGVEIHESIRALACILGFIPAAIALYVAFCDWTFAQEIIESFEDEFLDDECGCDCEDHPEDCTCECCSGKKEVDDAEEGPVQDSADDAPAESEDAPKEKEEE